jgi:hypothetical protein
VFGWVGFVGFESCGLVRVMDLDLATGGMPMSVGLFWLHV